MCLSGDAGQVEQQDPPGAAIFLAALPSFAKPAPPTPMANVVRELDQEFRGLPSKLMAAVNKPGSACKARQVHAILTVLILVVCTAGL
jgi:hypothetical protein